MSTTKQKNKPLFILMLNMFIGMVGIGLIIPVLPAFLTEFGASGQAMGYLVAAFGLTQFAFSPIVGELSDKYGRKMMIVLGLFTFGVSQWIFGVATEMWMLYASRLLGGAGAACMIPPMLAYVADITTEEKRAKGLGLLGAAMSLGFVIGPGIGGFLAEYGVRFPFYIAAAVAGISTVISLLFLPETLTKELQMKARASEKKRESMITQFILSFKAPYLMLLILIFTLTFGLANFEAIFGLFVDQKYGFTPKDISIIITVGALLGTLIQAVVIDRLVQRFGEEKIVNISFVLSAVSLLLMVLPGNFWSILAITLLFFAATSLLRPAINTLLSKMAGDEQGFVAGMNNAYMSLGNIIGPSIAGILYDVNIHLPYMFGAVILFGSVILSVGWSKRRARKQPSTAAI
ncbi:MFS transporter [Aneurinibacillus migulanus]|uniref:MFS transporter, DHA1 family, multidrug resistance protein n=1 Tax=Aneurinibacillus migulanus TaxID=47500 RepID=A0A0D1XHJ9_ANEMI|nr:tetracycline resistance MFS efflux pump [Aneurinibacillus migulanus]KIV51728.1 multidrug transporter [Aneurinibacillus migulanus]KON97844.1 multidrug transporter [Aneurinibacillus migulanus]MED0891072.1 tetracycline resistance MFS efflux pump [Aneurinibacillus migulanus]MED1614240.1 tetracycline resistance MFS efflux pump [Aneurinibacillus migulanus]SDH95543.1 MFS transporter, DHA1 family, multidrug resistance protein [Aneurinibacillus migulanus]